MALTYLEIVASFLAFLYFYSSHCFEAAIDLSARLPCPVEGLVIRFLTMMNFALVFVRSFIIGYIIKITPIY
jgi:hypothetical protein